MDEKKYPLGSHQVYKISSPEPIMNDNFKRKPFSNCLLFVLLAVFVFTLGCFAVYTALAMGAFQKSSTADVATSKPLVMERGETEPNINLHINVNWLKPDEEKRSSDEAFSTVRNIVRKFIGSDFPISSDSFSSEEPSSETVTKPKMKTFTIRSFHVSRIPRVEGSTSPFDGLLNSFGMNSPLPKPQTTEKKVFLFPLSTKGTTRPKPGDDLFPSTIFKDFENVLSSVFGSSKEENNSTSSGKPKVVKKIMTSDSSFFPKSITSTSSELKPREEVDIFKSLEDPLFERYKTNKKASDESDDFLKPLFGSSFPKSQTKKKQYQTGPLSPFGMFEPQIFFYDHFQQPKWTTYPKKYQTEYKYYTTTAKPTTVRSTSQTSTTESSQPTTTMSSNYKTTSSSTPSSPYTTTTDHTTSKNIVTYKY